MDNKRIPDDPENACGKEFTDEPKPIPHDDGSFFDDGTGYAECAHEPPVIQNQKEN